MPTSIREKRLAQFAKLRGEAYAAATGQLQLKVPARLRSINQEALDAWVTDWKPLLAIPPVRGGWNWAEDAASYMRKADSFHLAIWSGQKLCGLAVGAPTTGHKSLAIHAFEGSPDPTHPLKGSVLALVLEAADAYARVLGATRLRLQWPASELIATYERLGFQLVHDRGVQYCDRGVR